ncbi:MAG TPA: alpha/beta hydrolase, partial [Methanotrichaceae archaeon]|nr:alpha/beta hydrolase [Methanotrichaceae archaeon]
PVAFKSGGETLRGWLYLPSKIPTGKRLPAIVTANAMTAVKEINLPEYAERFAKAGFATIIFDYRYWGESSGEPRYHLSPMEQREDITNALTFLASQPEVDPNRIGGWGISLGGEHMLFLATWEPRLKAVVAVSTGISPQRESELLTEEEAKDRYRELLSASEAERAGRASAKITTMQAWCPEPTKGCAIPVKEAHDFYERARQSFAPMFENKLSSTSFQNLQADDMAFAIHLAKAPILILHPEKDVVPIEDVLFYYKRAPEPKRLVVLSGLHTTTYVGGKHLEEAAQESIAWFKQYL